MYVEPLHLAVFLWVESVPTVSPLVSRDVREGKRHQDFHWAKQEDVLQRLMRGAKGFPRAS